MRATFAYACEAHSLLLERTGSRREHQALAQEYKRIVSITDERVDAGILGDIVLDAASVRKRLETNSGGLFSVAD